MTNPQIAIESLPQFEHVEFEPMAEAAPIESLISWGITFFLLGIVVGLGWFLLTPPLTILYIAVGIYFGLILWVVYYIFASHKHRGIAIRERDVLYKHGLIWHTRTVIPFNRIQHIETVRGPIERLLGLATIKIFSAGGLSSDLSISGLEAERATRLKRIILNKANSENDTADDES